MSVCIVSLYVSCTCIVKFVENLQPVVKLIYIYWAGGLFCGWFNFLWYDVMWAINMCSKVDRSQHNLLHGTKNRKIKEGSWIRIIHCIAPNSFGLFWPAWSWCCTYRSDCDLFILNNIKFLFADKNKNRSWENC